jgi:hypothetical protein
LKKGVGTQKDVTTSNQTSNKALIYTSLDHKAEKPKGVGTLKDVTTSNTEWVTLKDVTTSSKIPVREKTEQATKRNQFFHEPRSEVQE